MNSIQTREIDRDTYQSFLSRVPHSAFHCLPWLEIIERIYPVRVVTVGHFDNEKLVAVTPLMRRSLGPIVVWGSPLRRVPIPPATVFCAPESHWKEALASLQEWSEDLRLHYLQLTLPAEVEISDFDERSHEVLENLELDLSQDLEILWGKVFKKTRHCVRKAVRQEVRIHWCHLPEILSEQSQLLHDTYARQGLKPNYPINLYHAILTNRNQLGSLILSATYKGRCIATVWVFTDQHKCYYWDAAAREEGRRLNANHLLVWCLIRWAKKQGYETLDFVGTPIGGRGNTRPGIGRFKRSMGAQPVPRYIVYRYSILMYSALQAFRTISRMCWKVSKHLRRDNEHGSRKTTRM